MTSSPDREIPVVMTFPEDLTGQPVLELWAALEPLVEDLAPHLVFDVSRIRRIDTVGLMMLRATVRKAKLNGGRPELRDPDPGLRSLLLMSRLDDLAPMVSSRRAHQAA